MLFHNIPCEKWAKYAYYFLLVGVSSTTIEIVLHRILQRTIIGGFLEGLVSGFGMVFCIYGLYLYGKSRRINDISPRENMISEM